MRTESMPRPRRAAPRLLGHGLTVLLAAAALLPRVARSDDAEGVREIRVERVKPRKEKYPTLRFLKANVDFIRAREDRLSEKPADRKGGAESIDPRFLAYRELLARIMAGRDSIARLDDQRQKEQLLASVTELGTLEQQLDQMDRQLSDQRTRLAVLEKDFTGDQRTSLMVVLSGYPAGAAIASVGIQLEDGGVLSVPLSDDQRTTLRQGGVVQMFHGLIEPREQVVSVILNGERWPSGDTGYVSLDPARDRLTVLKLDLSTVQVDPGAPSIQASTWVHDAGAPPIGS
ncbi:MAG TPA: hypothetical protein VMJ70_00520 [Candidatus Sulfotelmatobacter sp.]|nr:hypothetical protein [Candidatus Sulfotelmatobacter sp.]